MEGQPDFDRNTCSDGLVEVSDEILSFSRVWRGLPRTDDFSAVPGGNPGLKFKTNPDIVIVRRKGF